MAKNKFLIHFLIYFGLVVGYVLIYSINIESMLFPSKEDAVKSKVEFVYQQF